MLPVIAEMKLLIFIGALFVHHLNDDFFSPLSFRTELSDHLETIDYGLENLQQILNAQTINFDTSPLFDVNIV